jgi:hypothetical protein
MFYGDFIKSGLQRPGETLYMPHYIPHAGKNLTFEEQLFVQFRITKKSTNPNCKYIKAACFTFV